MRILAATVQWAPGVMVHPVLQLILYMRPFLIRQIADGDKKYLIDEHVVVGPALDS